MNPHDFWQHIHPPGRFAATAIHREFYPADFEDGRQLPLPIRPLGDGVHALASLIINQASFTVVDALANDLARMLAPYAPDIIVGLPTLGLTLAAAVAERLGQSRYVPLGSSRKFWYDEALSVPLSSVTTPNQTKRLYIDPRMLRLVAGRRVVLIDDVMSSGASIIAGLTLMAAIEVEPVALGFGMLQSDRWRQPLGAFGGAWPDRCVGVLRSPMLKRVDDGGWHGLSIG